MGSYLTTSRDTIFRPFAFPAPHSSYNITDSWVMFHEEIPILGNYDKNRRYTILYSHGNGTDIGICKKLVDDLADTLNVNVLAYDYPGYGLNKTGSPSEESCYATILKVYKYMRNVMGINPNDIILYGHSIGTGPTTWLAKQLCCNNNSPRSIILQSPYTSAMAVVSETAATSVYSSHMVSDRTMDIFDNYWNIQKVTCPVQIIHGINDGLIPCSQAESLYHIAPNTLPIYKISGGDHNNLYFSYKNIVFEAINNSIELLHDD